MARAHIAHLFFVICRLPSEERSSDRRIVSSLWQIWQRRLSAKRGDLGINRHRAQAWAGASNHHWGKQRIYGGWDHFGLDRMSQAWCLRLDVSGLRRSQI